MEYLNGNKLLRFYAVKLDKHQVLMEGNGKHTEIKMFKVTVSAALPHCKLHFQRGSNQPGLNDQG